MSSSLRTLAEHCNFNLGAAVAKEPYFFTDPTYRQLHADHVNLCVPANAMKYGNICAQPNQYDFSHADAFVIMKDIFLSRKLHIYIRIACLVLSLFIFSGCSWLSSFYIINNSDDDIMISYRVPRYISYKPTDNIDFSDCFETSDRGAPYITENVRKVSELRPTSPDRRQLNSNEYFCDVEERVVNFKVAPQTAVEIHWESNYLGHEKESERAMESGRVHRLRIEPLRLEGSQGSIVYEGDQAIKAFKKESNTKYVLEYN